MLVFLCNGCNKYTSDRIAEERLALDRQASTLPSLYITIDSDRLDSIHNSQKVKTAAEAYFVTADNDTIYEGDIKIKTRGNSSFSVENKKPYSITFPQKIQIFGLQKDKSYNLLANWTDGLHYLNNPFAFDLAQTVGLPVPKYTHLHLYCNGVYKGIYQMTNKADAIPQTVSITDLSKENKILNPDKQSCYPKFPDDNCKQTPYRRGVLLDEEPEDVTGGYIIEHNRTGDFPLLKSPSGFTSNAGDGFRIRVPKYAGKREVDYIETFYNEVEDAIWSLDGYNSQTGKHYSQYIDVSSFAKYYIIQELLQHYDACQNSFMMYKDADRIDSLLYAGPIWDFDIFSYNNPYFKNTLYVCSWYGESGGIFYHLYQHEDFRNIVAKTYIEDVYPTVQNMLHSNYLDSLQEILNVYIPEFKNGVQQRSDFLYKLWISDPDDIISIQIVNTCPYRWGCVGERQKVLILGDKSEGVMLPSYFPIIDNGDPTISWQLVGDSVPLPPDTIFFTSQEVEIRFEYPSKLEFWRRRIKKKLRKIFFNAPIQVI